MIRLYCRMFGHAWAPLGWLQSTSGHGWVCRRCRLKGREYPQ